MQANRTRAQHYRRQARESARVALECAQRGDIRGARSWHKIAEGEREAAAFWSGDSAPRMNEAPAFMEGVQA